MNYKDLRGSTIYNEDWYYSVSGGNVVPHRYVDGWPTDESRLATGRVLKMPPNMTPKQAAEIFKKAGIRNTMEL